MKVIEKYNDSLHNPYWKYQLGPETYEVKDTPLRVESIKKALRSDERFDFQLPNNFRNVSFPGCILITIISVTRD